MKKLLVLLMVLVGLAIFWMPKSFADVPPDFNPPQVSPTIQEELQQVEKLAAGRIREAKQLRIAQKAEKILDAFGSDHSMAADKEYIFSDPDSTLRIERHGRVFRSDWTLSIYYEGNKVFHIYYSGSFFSAGDIQLFRPGLYQWISKLDDIFDSIRAKKSAEKMEDLKNRFGL